MWFSGSLRSEIRVSSDVAPCDVRVLDLAIGVVMVLIALKLTVSPLHLE